MKFADFLINVSRRQLKEAAAARPVRRFDEEEPFDVERHELEAIRRAAQQIAEECVRKALDSGSVALDTEPKESGDQQ